MVRSEGEKLRRVVVCPPRKEYFKIDHLEAHNIQETPDPCLARKQHQDLVKALKRSRCQVIEISELKNHPNSVFVRDTALITPRGFIQLRMGLPTRRGEERWMAKFLKSLGLPRAGLIRAPATVEGGDIILAWPVAFIGHSKRTNKEGVDQITHLLARQGYEVRIITLPSGHLHLGGAMSLVDKRTVICIENTIPPEFFEDFKVIYVPDSSPTSGNVICLGRKKVIVAKDNQVAIRALGRAGFSVLELDLSEFVKGSGGPTCLILPVERG
mgnify:CR=1 FL=1